MIESNAFESNASANANADESNANASANASAAKESSASANANAAFALAFANASAFEHKPGPCQYYTVGCVAVTLQHDLLVVDRGRLLNQQSAIWLDVSR